MKVKRKSVGKKILLSVIVFTIIVGIVTCIVGGIRFQHNIQKMYSDIGYKVGEVILGEIDEKRIAEYAENFEKDDNDAYYEKMSAFLKRVELETKSAYIYIIVPDETGMMTYIYDSSGLCLGDKDPISTYSDELNKVYKTGERSDIYFVRKSAKYGYLTSSVLPVKMINGDTVALLLVDTFMETIENDIKSYVASIAGITLVLLILFCIGYWRYMEWQIIKPIHIIGKSANTFATNDAQITDELQNVNTKDEFEDLANDILHMEHSIIDYIKDITEVTAEKERIGAEIQVGTQIQADMLPRIFPKFENCPRIKLNATMNPAKEVGGDFFDFFFVDDDHLCVVCADVSGKGVPAALFMVIAKTIIKNCAMTGLSPAEVLNRTNAQLCESNDSGMFVTVWLAIIDLTTGKGLAVNAGHEHPAIMRAGGDFKLEKYKHNMAVATIDGIPFNEHEFQLYPGDKIFVYTDGVTEAEREDKAQYGEDRLLKWANASIETCKSAEEACQSLMDSVHEFTEGNAQNDDITIMTIKIK